MVLKGLWLMPAVPGGHVLVIGSERPWVEACVLHAGARAVTTLEFGKVHSAHPPPVLIGHASSHPPY
jgi:hypothetical protein